MLICSLSNFDTYLVTRAHKPPKPFTFSVKPVDNLNMFERAADYDLLSGGRWPYLAGEDPLSKSECADRARGQRKSRTLSRETGLKAFDNTVSHHFLVQVRLV